MNKLIYIGSTKYLYWVELTKTIVERTWKSYCIKLPYLHTYLPFLNYLFFTVNKQISEKYVMLKTDHTII